MIFVFDQAKIHTAFDDDALIASRMNVGPGGKQPVMRPSPSYLINGTPQRMTLDDGIPKGLKIVLEERGVNTKGMGKVDMVKKLPSFIDFRHEKNKVERLLRRYEMQAIFLIKFHPELNPIERVWGKAKQYATNKRNYTFEVVKRTISPALEIVPVDTIRKYFRKSRNYMHAYREGFTGYQTNDKFKVYTSHRKVSETESNV